MSSFPSPKARSPPSTLPEGAVGTNDRLRLKNPKCLQTIDTQGEIAVRFAYLHLEAHAHCCFLQRSRKSRANRRGRRFAQPTVDRESV